MKIVNTRIMINPSRREDAAMTEAHYANYDRYILIDTDLDFANRVALILEENQKSVQIVERLESLADLFPGIGRRCRYDISVFVYAAY